MNNKYLNIILSQPKPLKFITSRILMRTGFCQFFKIKQNGFSLHFSPSALAGTLWISPDDRLADDFFLDVILDKAIA